MAAPVLDLDSSQEALPDLKGEGGPKRIRVETTSPTALVPVDASFWEGIQTCVSVAVAASIDPLREKLQQVHQKTDRHEVSLGVMETNFKQHVKAMKEQDSKFQSRLDELQNQVLEIKETSQSPKSRQEEDSPTGPRSQPAPSYLVIIGGWKDGERRQYVETSLSELLAAARVSDKVSEVQLFGKRPRCARVSLQFSSDNPASKRATQQEVIASLRAQAWVPRDCQKPVWVTQDRTPAQRAATRAVAIIGSFLRTTMQIEPEHFEVDSWQAARTYLGDHRISGTSLSNPPGNDRFVLWPVRDDRACVSAWLDLQGVATFAGLEPEAVKAKWERHAAAK